MNTYRFKSDANKQGNIYIRSFCLEIGLRIIPLFLLLNTKSKKASKQPESLSENVAIIGKLSNRSVQDFLLFCDLIA